MPTRRTHITDYLAYNAQYYADKAAIVTDDRTLTWRQLHTEVVAAAAGLQSQLSPTGTQQVVALLLPNSAEFVVVYLAILETGHIASPLDPNFKALELQAVLRAIPPVLIITDTNYRPLLGRPKAPVIQTDELATKLPGATPPAAATLGLRLSPAKQIASLMFTSGTTGPPKAAPYTHANHLWNIELSTKLWRWNTDDSLLVSLPLSHWHGIVMGVSGALYHGNTLYLRPRFDAADTLAMLGSGKISIHQHVSLAYVKLAQHPDFARYDLGGVRLCVSASAALPPATWQEFKRRFGLEILECYGSAEAGRIASNTLTERLPGTPGRIIPGVQAKLGPGGEVLVKTPGLFPGYYNNPAATRAAFTADGWWTMGDLGAFDDEGHLYIKGRLQERMKKQGYSVYPRDLEWALQQHPAVEDVFVLGVNQAGNANDRLVYFVVGEVSRQEIQRYCKIHLPSAWRPDEIILLEAIPRTRTGKPRLLALRALQADLRNKVAYDLT